MQSWYFITNFNWTCLIFSCCSENLLFKTFEQKSGKIILSQWVIIKCDDMEKLLQQVFIKNHTKKSTKACFTAQKAFGSLQSHLQASRLNSHTTPITLEFHRINLPQIFPLLSQLLGNFFRSLVPSLGANKRLRKRKLLMKRKEPRRGLKVGGRSVEDLPQINGLRHAFDARRVVGRVNGDELLG